MKTIQLSTVSINLDIGDELRVKDLRKIQPILANQKTGEEIEMVVKIVCAFSTDENISEVIDNLSIPDFTKLSAEITKLLDTEKKTEKSSTSTAEKV
jgi:hypothetical protein